VGFRPFVYRLAEDIGLSGWVNNSGQGLCIEAEGPQPDLEKFLRRLQAEKPPNSFIHGMETWWLDAAGYSGFEIRHSDPQGRLSAIVMPDMATCPECLREIFDPRNRRFRYPFANCTHCGPRFSIIEALPYDRARTAMKLFPMCPDCEREYRDPSDRRFHAEPNACPQCGPQLELWDASGKTLATRDDALLHAADSVRKGKILALKGIGGFQLIVAARNENAVRHLRERKRREEKPFALMYPSFQAACADCQISDVSARLLLSSEAPIVLLRRWRDGLPLVAPGNPFLGVMLPYSPLHHLLMREWGFPVVATSGNLSDEPICTDEREALRRLAGIADLFLVHNRPIVRHVDDSVVRVVMRREQVLRRARGFAPLPLPLNTAETADPILAVGAHLKNTVALALGNQAFLSQHIGDLETLQATEAFHRVIADFQRLYDASPRLIVSDAHPDYASTKFAAEFAASHPGVGHSTVQHHIAHVLACLAENEVTAPALGVSWDGTGFGLDGTIWGGEFFAVSGKSVARVGHFRAFRLPGSEQAIQEPRRAALGLLYEIHGDAAFAMRALAPVRAFPAHWLATMAGMLKAGVNSPETSSAGRLFDALAALIGIRQETRFEGQAAMELEFALEGFQTDESYPFQITPDDAGAGDPAYKIPAGRLPPGGATHDAAHYNGPVLIFDWEPTIKAALSDLERQVAPGLISARFHNTLAEVIVAVARRIGHRHVALSGGCFQNRYLTERAVSRLEQEGFRPCWHQRVPPNDGGIAYGQIVAALRRKE
jgi:hydrogenase maturation protein HypF